MILSVYDMDGTIVDSTAALRQCQIEGMYRATGQDASQLEQLLKDKGLKGALAHLNIDQDTFFKTHYKTFDPFEAAKEGRMKVFDDALSDILACSIQSTFISCLISNSTTDATYRKLDAVDIRDKFSYVFAEVEKDKAKPAPYMAMQLRDRLIEDNRLKQISLLSNIGDQPVDMEFGEVLQDVLSTAAKKNIPLNNYFVDRQQNYNGNLPKSAQKIKYIVDRWFPYGMSD